MLAAKSANAKKIVILLHGYGSDGNDMISLAHYWRDILPDAIFIAPNAPENCDINPIGYQWFALDPTQINLSENNIRIDGVKKARPIIEQFLQNVWQDTGLNAKDTVLCGFSQGAMMALEVGLRLNQTLKGIIAFSGGLANSKTINKEIKTKPPICLVHGKNDEVVPPKMSIIANEILKKSGVNVSLYISPNCGHNISQDGLNFASKFISSL